MALGDGGISEYTVLFCFFKKNSMIFSSGTHSVHGVF